MNMQCLVLGQLGVNCYLLTDSGEAAVIDPGAECDKIIQHIEKSGCTLKKILLTHGHFDHIGAVSELAQRTKAPVYVHSGDAKMLTDNSCNLSFLTGEHVKPHTPDVFLDDIKKIELGETVVKVFHTPGHSEGCVSFLWGDMLFDGDLLFQGSIGRYDFGDLDTELHSIKFLMDNFDDSIRLYPGHGMSTTIGHERIYNPYSVYWNDLK